MLDWFKAEDRFGRPRERASLMDERPRVMAEVIRLPHVGVELRFVAVFEWPTLETKYLLLRRDQLPDVPGSFAAAKSMAPIAWREEHCAWGEERLLREMWSFPLMSKTELEAYRAKEAKRRRDTYYKNQKLVDERRHQGALRVKRS